MQAAPDRKSETIDSSAHWFLFSAGFILGVAGLAKLWTSFSDLRVLNEIDPIFRMQFRYVMSMVGSVELVIAGCCFVNRRNPLTMVLVASLSTLFLIYRIGLWWVGWKTPCSCLGNLTDALHISPTAADNLMKSLALYMVVASYVFLVSRVRKPAGAPLG